MTSVASWFLRAMRRHWPERFPRRWGEPGIARLFLSGDAEVGSRWPRRRLRFALRFCPCSPGRMRRHGLQVCCDEASTARGDLVGPILCESHSTRYKHTSARAPGMAGNYRSLGAVLAKGRRIASECACAAVVREMA